VLPIHVALVSRSDRTNAAQVGHVAAARQMQAVRDVGPLWSLSATVGRSPKRGQGQVEFLVEACDPCQGAQFAYTINGVLVSDFITPSFYDPRTTAGARYSFTGAVRQPRRILRGGYMTWHDPQSNHIWQQLWLGAGKRYRDLGEGDFSRQGSLRGFVDARTDHPDLDHGLAQTDATLGDARIGWRGATASAEAPRQPMRLEEEIERLLS
jgi:hypothetical protein